MIDSRPALIAQCTDTADVVRAVSFARENDLLLAVRGGGHNVAGNASCNCGIVDDLRPMKSFLGLFAEVAGSAPDQLSSMAAFLSSPEGDQSIAPSG